MWGKGLVLMCQYKLQSTLYGEHSIIISLAPLVEIFRRLIFTLSHGDIVNALSEFGNAQDQHVHGEFPLHIRHQWTFCYGGSGNIRTPITHAVEAKYKLKCF